MSEDIKRVAYGVADVCRILGISRPTVMRWLRSGKLPATMVGGKWSVPSAEIEKRLAYRIVRNAPVHIRNGPLDDAEVERISDIFAHALRQLGAPVRRDGLRKVVLGQVPVDALLWRFMARALSVVPKEPALQPTELSAEWDRHLEQEGIHPWTGEKLPPVTSNSRVASRKRQNTGRNKPGQTAQSHTGRDEESLNK
jgi:excisionase family DNA binding protein